MPEDPDLKKDVLDVRKYIEKSTSKVSLRDLEKKGFRQVKVLRAGDINQLIHNAVQQVLAKNKVGISEEERQRIESEARAQLQQQMAQTRLLQQEKQQLEAEAARIEGAKRTLEEKVSQLNTQLVGDRRAFEEEKRAFAREKQSLYEKGLEGAQAVSRNYEAQLNDLRDRAARAEARSEGAVSPEDHERLRERMRVQVEELEAEVSRYRNQLRDLEAEGERATRLKRRVEELEESEARAQRRAASLEEDVARLEAERAEAAPAAADSAEMQRLRMELEQRQTHMQELLSGIATSLTQARSTPAEGGDLSQQFQQLTSSLTDQLRRIAASGKGGAGDASLLMPSEAVALLAGDDVKLESNIKDVKLKEQSAAGVSDKLARLRNLKKGSK